LIKIIYCLPPSLSIF